jgi:hypothetical protein
MMSMPLKNLVLAVALLLVAASFSFSSAFLFPGKQMCVFVCMCVVYDDSN